MEETVEFEFLTVVVLSAVWPVGVTEPWIVVQFGPEAGAGLWFVAVSGP